MPSAKDRVITVAKKIRAARDERRERARKMQELAAEARRTGKNLSHRVDNTPHVWDLGDLVDELCDALDRLE